MGEHQRPKILGVNGKPAAPTEGVIGTIAAAIMTPEQALQADIQELQRYVASLAETVKVHHTALVELTAELQAMQRRSFRGRVGRAVARLEAWREWARGILIEIGLISPPEVKP